ncbi:MAG: hypothetical protein QW753_04785 [Thermofilum sp.]
MEIVLGVWDFILLVVGFVGLMLLLIIIALEYHYWRTRRRIKRVLVEPKA